MKSAIEINLELLLVQRETLVKEIHDMTKSFQTACLSIITYSVTIITLFLTNVITLNFMWIFVFLQIFFFILLFIIGLLTSMNNDRDYIRAIDRFLLEKYDINCLFYQGEISFQHINKLKSKFSLLTTIAGFIVAIGFIVFIFKMLFPLWIKTPENKIFFVIITSEILSIGYMIYKNFKYKFTGKSKFYDDVYKFLMYNGKKERQEKS